MSYRNSFFPLQYYKAPTEALQAFALSFTSVVQIKNILSRQRIFSTRYRKERTPFQYLQALNQIKMHITGNLLIDSEDRDSALYIIKQLQCITYMFSRLTIICLSIRQHYNTISYAFFHSSSPIHLALRQPFLLANCLCLKEKQNSCHQDKHLVTAQEKAFLQ